MQQGYPQNESNWPKVSCGIQGAMARGRRSGGCCSRAQLCSRALLSEAIRQLQNFAKAIANVNPKQIPITKPDTEMSKRAGGVVSRPKVLESDATADPPASSAPSQRQIQVGTAGGDGAQYLPKDAASKATTEAACTVTDIRTHG